MYSDEQIQGGNKKMEQADILVEESDMIQIQEPAQNNDPFDMGLGNLNSGMDSGFEMPTMDLNVDMGLDF